MGMTQCVSADDDQTLVSPTTIDFHLREIMKNRSQAGIIEHERRLPWIFDDFARLHIMTFENLEYKRGQKPWERTTIFDISEDADVYARASSFYEDPKKKLTLSKDPFGGRFSPTEDSNLFDDFDDSIVMEETCPFRKDGVDSEFLVLVAKELQLSLPAE